jgi:hypothetical protein
MHVIDELFALEAESVRETQLHLTRLGIGAYVIGDADDAFASLELLVTFLVGMTGAEMMADFKKKTGMSLAEATSKYTCKNC